MLEKIMELISLKDFKRLKELLEDANHADISECLDELQDEELDEAALDKVAGGIGGRATWFKHKKKNNS